MSDRPIPSWLRLITGLKYGIFFLVLLLFLPFTAFRDAPANLMLGGLFAELDGWAVFWTSVAFFAATWSLMFCIGLLVEGLRDRTSGTALPAAAEHLAVPVTRGQMAFFTIVALVQVIVVLIHAETGWFRGALIAAVAGFTTYFLAVILTIPGCLIDSRDASAKLSIWRPLRFLIRLAAPARGLFRSLHRFFSVIFDGLRLRHVIERGENGRPRLLAEHFFAATIVLGLLVLLGVVGWVFFPPAARFMNAQPPAGAFLYILLLLLIWTISALDFHLSRFGISPVLVLLAIMAVVYAVGVDHRFHAIAEHDPPPPAPVTPASSVAASQGGKNLVVVASAGGGILSSGWTTLVLRNMIADRPSLVREIRALSTVSGGSVGAAWYVWALDGLDPDSGDVDQALARAFDHSVSSSLRSSAYGFAFIDFWRIFFGNGLPFLRQWDRGILLESSWSRLAAAEGRGGLTLLGLRPGIAAGRLPAVILNSTVMEPGHRVMLTPLVFDRPPTDERGRTRRATTQSELLGLPGESEIDLDLWTAARMSATFPYVSPAAHSDLPGGKLARRYHLLDGGYYDIYGIASALDWLQSVLEARLEGRAGSFEKVLLVQLNPFAPGEEPQPSDGLTAALLGPLLGVVNMTSGSQVTRNEIELGRALDSWRQRFAAAGLPVCLESVNLRPPPDAPEGPLSWHLTKSQKAELQALWPPGGSPVEGLAEHWRRAREFLENPCEPAAR